MIALVWLVIAIVSTGAFAASGSRLPIVAAKSRVSLALAGLDAAVALCALHVFGPWTQISPLWWLVPVTIGAAGVGFAIMRWPSVPTLRSDRSRWLTMGRAGLHLTLLIGVLGVTLA